MKKALCGAILLLLAGCIWHRKTPLPDVLPPHGEQWENNVHALALPLLFDEEEPPADLLPSQDLAGEQTAQLLTAQQAGPKIDLYFYYMNRWYLEKEAVFMLQQRRFVARHQQGNIYHVTCTARARTGADKNHTHALTFPCGVWKADTGLQIVLPHDKKAEDIWAE